MCLSEDFKHKAACYYEDASFGKCLRVFFSDGSSAMVLYRLAAFFQKIYLGPVGFVFAYLNKLLNGCVIGRNAAFGPGFVIMHPVGVVINGGVKGGKNVVIESGVVIGAARNGLPVKVPAIGDNVFIGAGAKVLGGITIGNNVTIGANAVVVKDVADGLTVAGVPAKDVRK